MYNVGQTLTAQGQVGLEDGGWFVEKGGFVTGDRARCRRTVGPHRT